MLTHAFRGIVRHATLVAGDADFTPLAKAVGEEGTYLTLWSDRKSMAKSLQHAVDEYIPFLPRVFSSASESFLNQFPRPDTGVVRQPTEDPKYVKSHHLPLKGGAEALVSKSESDVVIYFPTSHAPDSFNYIRWQNEISALKLAEDLYGLQALNP